MASKLFPALLKYWRGRRGLSQLDLALEAGVSSRHVSFIEIGRTKPSEELVLRLLRVLSLPLRAQNEVLVAAGFAARYPEPIATALPTEIDAALTEMLARHEPWPMTVLGIDARVLRANRGAERLFDAFAVDRERLTAPLDMYSLLFDPRLLRPHVVDWERFAHGMVARLHRDVLASGDARLEARLAEVLAFPGVPLQWRRPDFAANPAPALRFALERDGVRVEFLVAITVFAAPQQVTVEELRLESCFPVDEATRAFCAARAASG